MKVAALGTRHTPPGPPASPCAAVPSPRVYKDRVRSQWGRWRPDVTGGSEDTRPTRVGERSARTGRNRAGPRLPQEGGSQARAPLTKDRNLARLRSRRGGAKGPPGRAAGRRGPRGARRSGAARPGLPSTPRGPARSAGTASSVPTSELNSFSLPTEMFRPGPFPGDPLNSRQPPRPRGPPTKQKLLAAIGWKLPIVGPLGRKPLCPLFSLVISIVNQVPLRPAASLAPWIGRVLLGAPCPRQSPRWVPR